MHDQIVDPMKIGQELDTGCVAILRLPKGGDSWRMYGDVFSLNAMFESSYFINCRSVGAYQFSGHVLIVYCSENGTIDHMCC